MATTKRSSNSSGFSVIVTLCTAAFERRFGARSDVAACFGLEGLVICAGVSGPYILKALIDDLGSAKSDGLWASVLVVAFIISGLGSNVLTAWRQIFSQRLVDRLNAKIVDDALRTQMPSMAGGRDGDSGRLLGLIERLPFSLQIIVEGLIWQLAPIILQVAISLVIIAGLLNPLYVIVLVLTLSGFALSTWFGAVRQHRFGLDASSMASQVSQTVGDVLRNARRVVLNGATEDERALIHERLLDRRNAFGRMLASQVLMALLQYGVAGLGLISLLVLGATDVINRHMGLGDFILVQAYAFRLVLPLSGFGFVISQAAIAMITIRDMLDMSAGEEDDSIVLTPPTGAAEIRLMDVSFSYGPGQATINNVTTRLAPGTFTVIAGPNGAGKSTLAQIMAGILKPSSGEVFIDQIPLQGIPSSQRYRYLIYVPQNVGLLNRSLLDNALYPPSQITQTELARLLRDWHFYEPGREIDFKAGVGEQGERLSGGQIQKLELARLTGVVVPALVLDESTSALDPVSETEIIQVLRSRLGRNTTLILITHRKSLAEMADQVLFMKDGALAGAGTHVALMQDQAYVGLWTGTNH